MSLQDKIEEIKHLGAYALQIWYGENVGCDDLGIPMNERNITIMFVPVGCLGEASVLFKGKLEDCLQFSFKTKPIRISNPPNKEEYENSGYYIWGTEFAVSRILDSWGVKNYGGKTNDNMG